MKNWMKLFLTILVVFGAMTTDALGQQPLTPRESPRAEVAQTVGDTRLNIIYHRPSVKGREIWGTKLVPYNEVWRTGANENTVFETSENVKINGQDLPAGKYGLHSIPNKDEWIVVFSKKNDDWGSFAYKPENDQLRVKVKPEIVSVSRENLTFEFDRVTAKTADVVLTWEKLRIPFTVDVGDVSARVLPRLRDNVAKSVTLTPEAQLSARLTAANYVLDNKIKTAYPEAMQWVDESLKMREAFNTLRAKSRLSAEMGNYKDAAMYGDKAVTVGKAAKPAVNAETLANFEKDLAGWKTKQ